MVYMNNQLLFLSKNDIPFPEAQVNIHQPTIREIAYISEKTFFEGCQLLNISKDILNIEDNSDLENISDFEIFMIIMHDAQMRDKANCVLMLLALLFPNHNIKLEDHEIILLQDKGFSRINQTNFDIFKDIIVSMFDLNDSKETMGGYNPVGKKASKIAEKLRKAKEKINKINSDNNDNIAVFSRYVSILSVGENKDMNELMDYSVYQLKDEFQRFQKKQAYDMYISAKMAGAKDLDEVDHWMDEIHS